MAKGYKYAGALNTPIHLPKGLASALDPTNAELAKEAREEHRWLFIGRVLALYEDCNVDPAAPQSGLDLALTLARRHVPGFSYVDPVTGPRRKGPGRPKLPWKELVANFRLWGEMQKRIGSGQTKRAAATHAARVMGSGYNPGGVARKYRRIELSLRSDGNVQAGFALIAQQAGLVIVPPYSELAKKMARYTKKRPVRQK